jgi:hypothetical protein
MATTVTAAVRLRDNGQRKDGTGQGKAQDYAMS